MIKIPVYNLKGEEVEKLELADEVFNVDLNNDLIHQAFVAINANQRQVLAHTKNRGDRAGSGIKPWQQKGTGRARVGSRRTPTWRKGGVAFGPRNDRNFSQKINKKMNSKAIVMVLSGKAKEQELIVVDKLELKERKTKTMAMALKNLKIEGRMLISFSSEEKDLRILSRNIVKTKNILTSQLNVANMLDSKYLVMSKESVKYLENKYTKK